MSPCENHEQCGFFEKHGDLETAIFSMLFSVYCNGPLREECARKRFLVENGQFPSDDIAPTGLNFLTS